MIGLIDWCLTPTLAVHFVFQLYRGVLMIMYYYTSIIPTRLANFFYHIEFWVFLEARTK